MGFDSPFTTNAQQSHKRTVHCECNYQRADLFRPVRVGSGPSSTTLTEVIRGNTKTKGPLTMSGPGRRAYAGPTLRGRFELLPVATTRVVSPVLNFANEARANSAIDPPAALPRPGTTR